MPRRISLTATLLCAALLAGCVGQPASSPDVENGRVYDAFLSQRSHFEVTASGKVARLLGTRAGRVGRHEGFLVRLEGPAGHGLTVKVEDNVDLTGPIPLAAGDDVVIHGEYIFDRRGGIVHWTHHDPRGRHEPGFVEVHGHRYS